jgi:hypothetical protein
LHNTHLGYLLKLLGFPLICCEGSGYLSLLSVSAQIWYCYWVLWETGIHLVGLVIDVGLWAVFCISVNSCLLSTFSQ